MELERRALYNSLRMNWLRDPAVKVQSWQVEDLREVPTEDLFKRLGWVYHEWMALAENFESPEDLTDEILARISHNCEKYGLASQDLSQEEGDRTYLIVFELWRRLLPERQTLSIFCDELDHQIDLYDTGRLVKVEDFQDVFDNLLQILNENADRGISPKNCMATLNALSANDIEQFLYDYLSEEIDQENFATARDFVEGFLPYVQDKRWFEFLVLRLRVQVEEADLETELQTLLKKSTDAPLDFYLEVLSFLTQHGDIKTFSQVSRKVFPLLQTEGDFSDFMQVAAEFYHFLDDEEREKKLLALVKPRNFSQDAPFSPQDPLVAAVKKIIF